MALSGVKACRLEQLEPRLLMSTVSASQMLSAESLSLAPKDSIVVDGDIAAPGDSQIYQFTTTARGRLTIGMTGESEGLDSFLELFNSNGRRIRSNNNALRNTLDSRISINVKSGQTYYVVASADIEGSGQYLLTLSSNPKDDIGSDLASAKPKRLNKARGTGRFSGTINYTQDIDVFVLVATQSGLMRINQTAIGGGNSLQGQILVYDGQGQLLTTSQDANGSASLDVVRGQTYFLGVTGLSGSQGKYKIKIAPTQTHLFASASQVDLPSEGSITIDADRLEATAAHGYVFTAKASGIVYVGMAADSSEINPYLRVYNSKQRRIAINDNASGHTTDSRIRLRIKQGETYYIEADSAYYTSGAYRLILNSDPVDDIGNSFGAAKEIRLNKRGTRRIRGAINYGDDIDVLSLVATITGTMSVDMQSIGRGSNLTGEMSAYSAEGNLLTQDPGDGQISFTVIQGQTYYLKAASSDMSTGRYRLQLATEAGVVPPPAPQEAPQAGNAVTGQIVSLAGGWQLLVAGTDLSDTITLSQSADYITLITSGGAVNFDGIFTSIVVYGFAGDDVIQFDNTVTAAGWIYGGAGDDSIFEAGAGTAMLYGQAGDDLIVSVGGNSDILYGGEGFDSFWADGSDNVADVHWTESQGGTVHQITEFYQPETLDAWSDGYVSLQIAGQDIADPTLTAAASGYRNFSELPLFADGPQYDDIAQGGVGDCYLMAVLSSLADTDPEIIDQMITSLGDGTYAVRFFRDGREVYIRLDADLPVNSYGSVVYADLGPDSELWVPLVEKAYAYFRRGENSYASLDGGWMADVYQEVTNMPTAFRWSYNADQLYTFLDYSLSRGHATTMGTYNNPSYPIIGSHAYVVVSVETTAEGRFVTVYNPWGIDGRDWDSNSSDGLLRLSIEDIQSSFFAAVVSVA